jgi:predicted acetyltransferase
MQIEVRHPALDEIEAAIEVISTAFLERPDARAVADDLRGVWDLRRTWVAWDGGRACGTFRSWGTRLTVPGGAELPAAAVAAVTVLPTHRRRGILRELAAREHAALRERGEVAGLLYASEYTIYGRFGYAPAVRMTTWTVDARAARPLGDPAGRVELVPADAASRDVVRAVFEAWRRRQPGEIWRRDVTWDLMLGLREEPWGQTWKGWLALHRGADGEVDGYVRYRATPAWDDNLPTGTLEVNELHALTEDAEADLFRYLLSVDLVTTVKLAGRRERERFPWRFGNARAARLTDAADGLWVRLFDVPRALEARTYERSGELVLEVIDDEAWGGTRRYALEAGPDGATCRPTDRAPDLTLPVAALSGAYLGGTRLAEIAASTGSREHRPGALAEADALLRTAEAPWCSTFF